MNYDLAAHVYELGMAMNRVQQRAALAVTGWSASSGWRHGELMKLIRTGESNDAYWMTRLLVRARRQDGGTIQ